MSVFHTFGKEKESVPLLEKPFDLGSTSATEEKRSVRNKEGQMIPGLDDGSKGINVVAHIRIATDYCNYNVDKFGNELTFIKPYFWNEGMKRKTKGILIGMIAAVVAAVAGVAAYKATH